MYIGLFGDFKKVKSINPLIGEVEAFEIGGGSAE